MTKILIVEDDHICGNILQKIIGKLGFQSLGIVQTAENTIFLVGKEMPDIVLMDINLYGLMDGIHTAEILSRYYGIPIIFITSNADANSISRAREIGAGYIIKPFTSEEIKQTIYDVLDRKVINQMDLLKNQNGISNILVRKDERLMFVPLYDIYLIEAQGHAIVLHTSKDVYHFRGSLKNFESLDHMNLFYRCHKSFLVQVEMIESFKMEQNYSYKLKMINNDLLIPVSRHKIQKIKKIILQGEQL